MNTHNTMRRFARLGLALPVLMAAALPAAALAADAEPMATRPAAVLPNPAPITAPAPLPESFAPQDLDAPGAPDGKVHGMVSVGVGTGGYREAAMALNGQLANGATVAIAVDVAQIGGGRVRRERAPQPSAAN